MNFLRLPSGAISNAHGGLVLAYDKPDLTLSYQNPALTAPAGHARLHSNFLLLPGGAQAYFISGLTSTPKSPFVSSLSLQYVNHGNLPLTDAGGNELGSFRPREWSLQFAVSRSYKNRWRGGVALQFAQSSYASYRAAAFMGNIGICYRDTSSGWEAGAVLRHLGQFIRRFYAGTQEQLPIELAFGIWKKLSGSPFSIGCTMQRMQQWRLDDAALYDPQLSPAWADNRRSTFAGQFFNHLIIQTRVDIHPAFQLLGGYNFLRRRELSVAGGANGLAGFSVGMRAHLPKIQLAYGRTQYQAGQSMNQLSMEFSLKPVKGGWRR